LKQSRKNLIVIKDGIMNLETARRLLERMASDVLETEKVSPQTE